MFRDKPCLLLLSILISTSFFTSCRDETTSPPVVLQEYEKRLSESILLNNFKYIVADNPIGFIYVHGQSRSDVVDFVLDKKVKAAGPDEAQIKFNEIVIFLKSSGDTMIVTVLPTESQMGTYGATLNISIPYSLAVSVKAPNNGLYMDNLFSNVKAEVDYEKGEIVNHSGSLETNSINGEIDATISIPAGGFCKCKSINGDIIVSIPATTSATIKFKSVTGTITFNKDDFSTSNYNFLDNEVTGTLGTGNGEIILESTGGNITVKKLP